MDNLFRELRRRNVFRVAGIYAVVGWLLVQIAVALETAMQMPGWFDSVVTSLLLLGFPIVLIGAWAFEMTPAGVKRTSAVSPDESITHKTGRKLDYALLVGLVLVAAIVLGDRFIPRLDDNAAVAATAPARPGATLSDKSIAVLPFADLSPEGDQEYFADGLSEELLNVLAQIDELQVAGRTSSFAFKDDNRDLREIGELLNVAHILEGSVRKSGNQIRVTAQLINTADGYHVFSETYEGDLSDIFRVQDEISREITTALRTEWLGEEAVAHSAPENVAAFDLYLQARQLIYTRNKAKMEEAERLLDRALQVDPNYAPALAQKAIVNMLLSDFPGSYGNRPHLEAAEQSVMWADRAIALDPTLGEAYAAKGLARGFDPDIDETVRLLRMATELNPGLSDARNWLSTSLVSQGKLEESVEVLESIVEIDPFYTPAFNNLVQYYSFIGDYEKAVAMISRMERVSGETSDTLQARGAIASAKGDVSLAATLFGKALQEEPDNTVLRGNYGFELGRLGELEQSLATGNDFQKPIILFLLGRNEEAMAALEALPEPDKGGSLSLSVAIQAFGLSNRAEELLAYLDRYFDSLDDAVALSAYDAGTWLPYAAAAYRDAGRVEEMEQALDHLDRALQTDRDAGAAHSDIDWLEASLSALRGDSDAAISHLQDAMDAGMAGEMFLHPSMFDSIRLDPRFREIEVEMNERINRERQEFGLPDQQGM